MRKYILIAELITPPPLNESIKIKMSRVVQVKIIFPTA
jgi:hypothetical protein